MAKNLNPKCKICRRAGRKLYLRGERCYSPKCSLIKRKYPPGFHGPRGRRQTSEYGEILREKQNLKNFYGLLEKQLKNYFLKAKKKKGNSALIFLTFLEKRLDNVIYQTGFFISRKQIRQIINHGLVKVNGRKVKAPSYEVKVGELITFKKKESLLKEIQANLEKKTKEVIPEWIYTDEKNFEIKILRMPEEKDLPKEFDIHLVLEFYGR